MKPTTTIDPEMLANDDKFQDPFFKRFRLRHAEKPLQLNDKIAKDYFFPTFYGDVTCAMAIFHCDYKRAEAIMPGKKIKPVMMLKGRSLVAFSCYEYKNVMGVGPYNEIAMTIPIMVNPGINVPVLPMVSKIFNNFGYYVFFMPVTSLENRIRGNNIWGLPKVVHEIDVADKGSDCVTTALDENGEQYINLRVPKSGEAEEFDETSWLYMKHNGKLIRAQTNFKANFNVTKHMELLMKTGVKPKQSFLTISGNSPSAKMLRDLDIEEHPFQLRYAEHMNACFDLPDPNYKPTIQL
jgi:hypothetical protein